MKRMGTVTKWTLGLLLLGLVGCEKYVLSLHSLQTEENKAFEAVLLGKWVGEGGVWEFTKDEEDDYIVRQVDMIVSSHFKGQLVQLGDHQYLELTPMLTAPLIWPHQTGYFNAHLVLTHTILKVELEASQLRMRRLRVDGLQEMLKLDPNAFSTQEHGDHLLLTGDTEELQAFVQTLADANDLWQDEAELHPFPRLFKPEHMITNDAFLGEWRDPNGTLIATVGKEKRYNIRFADADGEAEPLEFSGSLIEINGITLLAAYVDEPTDITLPDWFALISLDQKELRLKFIEVADTQKFMENGDLARAALADPDAVMTR